MIEQNRKDLKFDVNNNSYGTFQKPTVVLHFFFHCTYVRDEKRYPLH